jgi:hypothetical protein
MIDSINCSHKKMLWSRNNIVDHIIIIIIIIIII